MKVKEAKNRHVRLPLLSTFTLHPSPFALDHLHRVCPHISTPLPESSWQTIGLRWLTSESTTLFTFYTYIVWFAPVRAHGCLAQSLVRWDPYTSMYYIWSTCGCGWTLTRSPYRTCCKPGTTCNKTGRCTAPLLPTDLGPAWPQSSVGTSGWKSLKSSKG